MPEVIYRFGNERSNRVVYKAYRLKICESEGVLMIITYFEIIVFHLIERIALVTKSSEAVLRFCYDMLGFSYLAKPTRHEVHI